MVRILLVVISIFTSSAIFAQNVILEVSKDTISLEEQFEIKFTSSKKCSNVNYDFDDFLVTSGPNVSSQFSFVNGESSWNTSVSYQLTAIKEGTFELPSSFCGEEIEEIRTITVIRDYISQEQREVKIQKTRPMRKI